ncbi:glycerate kinase [Acetobacterium bakii]|uniref:Glycerate kinase n=1 Tax=Acetobacterium bakii TaxID=52689 RepID=A0A0L6TX61_9FIRM|nr:glycerate kinase [Acetobacterium bakii]KNZ40677.1 hypothetical protein AKG39_16280 [Acetobacterium bakii]
MKIIIAPDSYKGSLSAIEVCNIIENAIHKILPAAEIIKIPISDGGEGMVDALLAVGDGKKMTVQVQDPLFRKITAEYGILDQGTAVIEMAAASGLTLLTEQERNPLLTSTIGTGELIFDALKNQRCHRIILGIGGSATNDGGMGAATALGVKFYDHDHNELIPCGESLEKIVTIDMASVDPQILHKEFIIACDVDNPLCGTRGAAQVYGPQKGATGEMVRSLDKGLMHLGRLLENKSGKDLLDLAGIGAAGGMALPLVALFDAQLKSGLEIVLDRLNFDELIQDADLIITGEGKTDVQSAMGKVVSGVGKRAYKQKIPVIVISGALEEGYESLYDQGITGAFATYNNSKSLEWHMEHAREGLETIVINLFRSMVAVSGKLKR